MDVIKAISTRRSIRRYTGEVVGEDDIIQVLKAGFQAPSAHNNQPWHFVIVKDGDTLEKIAAVHPYAKMLPKAGCGVAVCGDKEKEHSLGFLVEDCSAAIENMLLAAHGIGLGAVWCGLHPVTKLTKAVGSYLNLPDNIIPVGLVVIGNKDEDKDEADRYDKSRIHYEKW